MESICVFIVSPNNLLQKPVESLSQFTTFRRKAKRRTRTAIMFIIMFLKDLLTRQISQHYLVKLVFFQQYTFT
jgi:hypothetical protein